MKLDTPSSVTLTCNISGKVVTWTNKTIIAKKIEQYGSLEAFASQYVSKGVKNQTNKIVKKKETKEQSVESFKVPGGKIVRPILEQGIKLGKMTPEDYKRVSRIQKLSDGNECTITTQSDVADAS
jgi:flagellar hook assembly protein FlgD